MSPGKQLIAELRSTRGLPLSVALVGEAIGGRMIAYPDGAFGGCVKLSAVVERKWGIRFHERTVQRATEWLRREGFVVVACCGGVCAGGRGHAAVYRLGWRRLGQGAQRLGRFFLRRKYGVDAVAPREVSLHSDSKTNEVRRSARFRGGRSGAAPPIPRPAAAAPPERLDDGAGLVHIRDLLPRL